MQKSKTQLKDQKHFSDSAQRTWDLAKEIFQKLSLGGRNRATVLLLQGELGAGKTTFCQGMLKAAGAEGPYTSPTFVIMKRYELDSSKFEIRNLKPISNFQVSSFKFIYHFDCYRVGAEDILDLGWEEIISDPRNLVLVEWSERIEKIWPKGYVKLDFSYLEENKRRIMISNL